MSRKTESVPLVRTGGFYVGLVLTFGMVLIFNKLLPEVLPFKIYQFFFIKFSWEKFTQIPWFLLLVGPGLTLFSAFTSKNGKSKNI